MKTRYYSLYYKISIVIIGSLCFLFALANFDTNVLSWFFVLFSVISILVAPKLTLSLPYLESHLSFEDIFVFLVFILYGGEAAIILATLEITVNCFYLKRKGIEFSKLTIPFNIAATAFSTTITYLVILTLPSLLGVEFNLAKINGLISVLGILAFSQFITSSSLAAIYYSLQFDKSIWEAWKRICFSSSITQACGAGLAGVFYSLLTTGDPLLIIIVTGVLATAYIFYRNTVNEINSAMSKSQRLQEEKAETEKYRRIEAEQYAKELASALENEEKISEALRQSKEALEHAAYHDILSELPNRSYLIERIRLLIEIGVEVSQNYYVLFLDLSRFKNINDRLGHTIGDHVLNLVSKRLRNLLREEDTVARLGGDEFAIILNDLSSIDKARKVAEKIHSNLSEPFYVQGHRIYTGLNIGIAHFNEQHTKPEDILRDADIAMHNAKLKGSGVAVFTKELSDQFLIKINLEADLRFAIEREEFYLQYQPIISLSNGSVIGFEALVRWNHPVRGFIPPDQFISIAEETGSIIPMTHWILKEACNQIVKWKRIAPEYENLFVSVNISGKHLSEDTLVDDVCTALEKAHLNPQSLKLEITESSAMEDPEKTIEILKKLKEMGVRLSLDDFGTGYSSLNYLHRLPFDTLKIDRTFITELGENGENSEILRTIISLAKNLTLRVIAEGIETHSQFNALRRLNCDYGQGYLMSKPLPKDQIENLLSIFHDWVEPEFVHKYYNIMTQTRDEIPTFITID